VLLAWFGNAVVVYATVAMTILVVVFSEILPKTAAFNVPDRIALAVARPMYQFVRFFAPVLMTIEALVRCLLNHVGMNVGEDHQVL
jgi:Mg2+/Co2+ transporter CorB